MKRAYAVARSRANRFVAPAVSGVVLGAMYMLWLAQRMLFGAVKAPHLPLADINLREKSSPIQKYIYLSRLRERNILL